MPDTQPGEAPATPSGAAPYPPAVDPWADSDPPWTPTAPGSPQHDPPPPVGPPAQTPSPPVGAPVPRQRQAPRRRRRWPRVLMVIGAATVVCCCGLPGYFSWPIWQQYPATATLPAAVADLRRHDDAASRRAAERLRGEMDAAHWLADDVFAGVYGDPTGKVVVVFGALGLRLQPGGDLDAELDRIGRQYAIENVQQVDAGDPGGHQRCGTGRSSGDPVVVCGWADHGSLGISVFTRRSVKDSAALLTDLRQHMISRG